jgi:hypothetical protein
MTEAEWLACDRVNTPLMNWLRNRGSDRRFFLAAAGWVRQVERHLSGEEHRALLPLVESFADGGTGESELNRKCFYANLLHEERVVGLMREGTSPEAARRQLAADAAAVLAATPPNGWMAAINALKEAGRVGKQSLRRVQQMVLLRDIFGNPLRPVAFDPSWRTSAAVGIAQTMYESRDFAAMPILADALEDAGCDSADVLTHCRGDGPHVRGCWVVDLVLGKA